MASGRRHTVGGVRHREHLARFREERIGVEAVVENAGKVDTDEVVQVYVQNEGAAHAPRNPRLCAFRRVCVPAGQAVKVALAIPAERLKVVDAEGAFIDEGTPVFYAGLGQPDARTEALTGHPAVRF